MIIDMTLFIRELALPECPAHAELFRELPAEDLVYAAHTYGMVAGQMDAAALRRGIAATRREPIRGGFRFLGAAAEAYQRGYEEEVSRG